MNLYPVTVISDFYDKPDEIRKYALAQKYTYRHEIKNIDYVFPGSRTKELRDLSYSLYEKINHIISYTRLRM